MDCQIHLGGCDCGLFAIANATASPWRRPQQAVLWPGENEMTPLPVPGKAATFAQEEKQTSSEESGLLRRLLHLQNARNGQGREVGRMHHVLEIVPHRQMSEHISKIFRWWLGLPWLFILGTLIFISFCIMHFIFIRALVCYLYVIHVLLAHLHCLILAPSLFT